MRKLITLFFFIFLFQNIYAKDWPVYKGNLYFTGNNDEIIVKNNEIKWIFIAKDRIFNPAVSEGKIYFLDIQKNIYCVDEETGSLLWTVDIKTIAKRFESYGNVSGKIKYPLIYGDSLLITDSIAIYSFNKHTGEVLWARTGLVQDDYGERGKKAVVEGIYADPFIYRERIYYGTRNFFYSRSLKNGELIWENGEISSYSAFGTFYGNYIFTQSRDYANNAYYLFCINLQDGKTVWKRQIEVPFKIFPPVVHEGKVIIPSAQKIYAFELETGKPVYVKDLKEYITSPPAFTEKYIRLTLSNRKIVTLDAETGDILDETLFPEQSGPKFVTIRDQIYVAYGVKKSKGGKEAYYTVVEAYSLEKKQKLWTFEASNPGTPSEPAAENGILYLPAGNMLYALGEKGDGKIQKFEDILPKEEKPEKEKPPMREMELEIDTNGDSNPVEVEVTQKKDGKTVYSEKMILKEGKHKIEIPKDGEVEITADMKNHLPETVKVGEEQSEGKNGEKGKEENNEEGKSNGQEETNKDKAKIEMKKVEKEKSYVMNNVHFETGESYLKKDSIKTLEKIVKLMKENPDLKLEVRGHTDSTGSREFNMKLSRQRANAVVEYLIKNGISPDRLKAVGMGPDHPIADNKTKEGRAKNRRTEFIFH